MYITSLFLLLLPFKNVFGYQRNVKFRDVNLGYHLGCENAENIYCVEPLRTTPCMLFFTGGSASMTPLIYENFLLNVVQKNIVVCAPPFRYECIDSLIDNLSEKYGEVVIAGHSSGCTVALNKCDHPKVNKMILMDPVNTRINNLTARYNISNINSLLFINAMKSYHVTLDPFGLPFIPFLRITKESLFTSENCSTTHVDFQEHGHSDILNPIYANFMHFTRISVGNRNRSYEMFKTYHNSIAEAISNFIRNKH